MTPTCNHNTIIITKQEFLRETNIILYELIKFVLFVSWHINLRGLFDDKAILVKEQ